MVASLPEHLGCHKTPSTRRPSIFLDPGRDHDGIADGEGDMADQLKTMWSAPSTLPASTKIFGTLRNPVL